MHVPLKLIWMLISFVLTSSVDSSAILCLNPRPRDRIAAPDIWQRNEPILVGPNHQPLTFSIDSEFTSIQAFRFLSKTPEGREQLKRNLWIKYRESELSQMLDVSLKQFRRFHRNAEAGEKTSGILITDLNPTAAGKVLHMQYRTSPIMAKLVESQLRIAGYRVEVSIDISSYELRVIGSFDSPKEFSEFVYNIHQEIPGLQTHFHLGIPTEMYPSHNQISHPGTMIARAIEAMIVLDLASSRFKGAKLPYFGFTSLGGGVMNYWDRGIIRFRESRFHTPFRAHDLEIRQWNSVPHAMELLADAVVLAQRTRDHLQVDESKMSSNIHHDPYVGNILGALRYVQLNLAQSQIERERQIANTLGEFYERGFNETKHRDFSGMSDGLRTDLARYLSRINIGNLLTHKNFLGGRDTSTLIP